MTRVLVIAYHFPPIGGAGVQRSLKLIRDLPGLGISPTVVTGPRQAATRWTPSDEDLAAEVPASVEVIRLPGPAPAGSRGWRARGERWLRTPTAFSRWWHDGVVAAGRQLDVDLVYASMSPFESAAAAAALSRDLGVPWVADLRDPWALDEMTVFPSAIHRRLERRKMGHALGRADAVIMNTHEATRRALAAFPGLERDRVTAIPNGFDGADFDGPAPPRDDETFRIVHTGYLHTELGIRLRRRRGSRLLGGAERGLDVLTRSHVVLLEALDALVARDPSAARDVELHLAGVLSPVDEASCRDRAVRIRRPGYLGHLDSVGLVRSADLLFLPMQDLRPGRRASIVPGKTYEYLAAGRPILAAVPAGDARDLLAGSGRAAICGPSDAAAMTAIVAAELDRFRRQGRATTLPVDDVADFERGRLSARIADVFARAVARGSDRQPAAGRSLSTAAIQGRRA